MIYHSFEELTAELEEAKRAEKKQRRKQRKAESLAFQKKIRAYQRARERRHSK